MKRTLIKILGKQVLAAAALTGIVFMIVPTQAKATTSNIEILSDNNQATVQYIGSVEDGLYFSVKLNNPNGDKFTLVIKDQNGSELYVQNYSDKNFSKKIKLLKNDEVKSYEFTIKSANKDLQQTFVVNTSQKIIDEVIVTKL